MSHAGSINKREVKYIGARRESEEHHESRLCRYEKRYCEVKIDGKSRMVHFLIRVCKCKIHRCQHKLLKKEISYDKIGDGVEMHLSPECCYMPRKIPEQEKYKLVKFCRCE